MKGEVAEIVVGQEVVTEEVAGGSYDDIAADSIVESLQVRMESLLEQKRTQKMKWAGRCCYNLDQWGTVADMVAVVETWDASSIWNQ